MIMEKYNKKIDALDKQIKALDEKKKATIENHRKKTTHDEAYNRGYNERMQGLKARYEKDCAGEISQQTKERNKRLAKEVYLSINRYPAHKRLQLLNKLYKSLKKAMEISECVYSIHMADTVDFVRGFCEESGRSVVSSKIYKYEIPHTFSFHTKTKKTVDVAVVNIR